MKPTLRTLVASTALMVLSAGTAMAMPPQGTMEAITLPGTGDSQDVLRALAQDYSRQYPERSVSVPDSIGSDGGVRVVGTGEAPIGRVARQPNAAEIAQYGQFRYVEFARVPVVFVVTPQAAVSNLSEQQICDIFAGRTTNWRDVGGQDLAIAVQSRPDGSNLQTIRKHMACFSTLEVTPTAQYNHRNADLVASMQTVAGAIGFMPFSEAESHGYQMLSIDGLTPRMPEYKLGIGLGFVYQKDLSPSLHAFLDYLQSPAAQHILRQTGHLPVTGQDRTTSASKAAALPQTSRP